MTEAGLPRVQLHHETVLEARQAMKCGLSMQQTAIQLGVRSSDLDYSLWHFIGVSDEDLQPAPSRPAPMF